MCINKKYFLFAFFIFFLFAISVFPQHMMKDKDDTMNKITKAVCVIHPTKDSNVHGLVTFTKVENGIKIVADIKGLKPGEHGFHIHQFGDCSSDDGTSAGGHFNPANMPHAGPKDNMRHEGDMGNITADANGNSHLEWTDNLLSLDGDNSIIGRGVIVHADKDDLKSQPVGNAGARLGCGVIGIAKQ